MDYNFFDPIKKPKKKTSVVGLALVAVVLIGVAVILIMLGLTWLDKMNTQDQLDTIKAQMDSPEYSLGTVNGVMQELEQANKDLNYFAVFEWSSLDRHTVNKELFNTLSPEIPTDLALNTIEISGHEMTLQGSAKSIAIIAQFEYNLRETDLFENNIVNDISENTSETMGSDAPSTEASYDFTMTLTITGESLNEYLASLTKNSETESSASGSGISSANSSNEGGTVNE